MNAWQNRSLDEIFYDAIVVKIRDRQVANRPIYAVILDGLAGLFCANMAMPGPTFPPLLTSRCRCLPTWTNWVLPETSATKSLSAWAAQRPRPICRDWRCG